MRWHTVTHGRGSEGENWRKQWVASTLHTTSEHGVSSITTADVHTSAASSRLNWRPPADLNGFVHFAERRNLVSARVPVLYPVRTQWRTYLGYCSQEGRSSELGLRRGVGQAAHTLNNPHVECTGVLLCVIREYLQLQLNCIGDISPEVSLLPLALTERPASFSVA